LTPFKVFIKIALNLILKTVAGFQLCHSSVCAVEHEFHTAKVKSHTELIIDLAKYSV